MDEVPNTRIWAIRGATSLESDSAEHLTERVNELVSQMMERNGLANEDLVSVIFTATADIVSMFPATAARKSGLDGVPLLCAGELAVTGALGRCIRILMHAYTSNNRAQIRHVYLHEARSLRDDIDD